MKHLLGQMKHSWKKWNGLNEVHPIDVESIRKDEFNQFILNLPAVVKISAVQMVSAT